MTIVELITIILFFFFFGYGLVRFFMDLTEYVAWRWQKMSEKRFTFYEYDTGLKTIEDGEKEESYTIEEVVGLLNEQQATIQSLKEENRKLRNIHLSIDLTYSYGYGRYLADVRVIDNE